MNEGPDQNAAAFYDQLPAVADANGITDLTNYRSLPAGWLVATSDIVASTEAVAAGRYKVVNTVGASVISAVANRLQHRNFPFVFGGDGAALAIPGDAGEQVASELAAVCIWAREELQIELRAAIMPIEDIRKAGYDVLVAKFQVAPDVAYAMFTGGGLAYAENVMKRGGGLIKPAPSGTRPDLTGLSCRWQPVRSRNGVILSVLAAPRSDADPGRFMNMAADIIALAEMSDRTTSPLPPEGPPIGWPPKGLKLELAASHAGFGRITKAMYILGEQAVGWICDRTGWNAGRFNAQDYRRDTARNSDFRKLDDGLKLTLDVTTELAGHIEQMLQKAEADQLCIYGLHRQDDALVTCIVPSTVARDHIHFIDGADGGYVSASRQLKAKL